MKIGCVLLAAGEGARLGKIPKALILVNGFPLIQRQLQAAFDVGAKDVVVVTGHYRKQIEPIVENLPIKIVRNDGKHASHNSSVRLGIEALSLENNLVLMMLCDQPLINIADLQELVHMFNEKNADILVPVVKGVRGNPVIFSGSIIEEILKTEGQTCRQYMDENPSSVYFYDTGNEHYIVDVDEVGDVEVIREKWQVDCILPGNI